MKKRLAHKNREHRTPKGENDAWATAALSPRQTRGEKGANRDDGSFLSRGCRKMMQNRLKRKKMGKK